PTERVGSTTGVKPWPCPFQNGLSWGILPDFGGEIIIRSGPVHDRPPDTAPGRSTLGSLAPAPRAGKALCCRTLAKPGSERPASPRSQWSIGYWRSSPRSGSSASMARGRHGGGARRVALSLLLVLHVTPIGGVLPKKKGLEGRLNLLPIH